jgi:hypothetical protein
MKRSGPEYSDARAITGHLLANQTLFPSITVPTDGIRAVNAGDRDFGTSPIFGQLSGKPLLASTKHLGSREAKHNGV